MKMWVKMEKLKKKKVHEKTCNMLHVRTFKWNKMEINFGFNFGNNSFETVFRVTPARSKK